MLSLSTEPNTASLALLFTESDSFYLTEGPCERTKEKLVLQHLAPYLIGTIETQHCFIIMFPMATKIEAGYFSLFPLCIIHFARLCGRCRALSCAARKENNL